MEEQAQRTSALRGFSDHGMALRAHREHNEPAQREHSNSQREEVEEGTRVTEEIAKEQKEVLVMPVLPEEPEAREPNVTKIVMRLESGEKISRRFYFGDEVQVRLLPFFLLSFSFGLNDFAAAVVRSCRGSRAKGSV